MARDRRPFGNLTVTFKPRHGHIKTCNGRRVASPTYRSWQAMRNRCLNPRSPDYPYYGGRGIRICDDWESFELFLADMGARPRACSLDRIDVNANYDRDNCRWAMKATQNRNQRRVVLTKAIVRKIRSRYAKGGVTHLMLAMEYKVDRSTVSRVIRGDTW